MKIYSNIRLTYITMISEGSSDTEDCSNDVCRNIYSITFWNV